LNCDPNEARGSLWLWNLACEGTTAESDLLWLPLINNLHPQKVFILRGSLESIIRPHPIRSGIWPFWIPYSWRGYAALDPRCYFSTTWWRRLKQRAGNQLKQRVRFHLLASRDPAPMMSVQEIREHLSNVLSGVAEMTPEVFLIGLLPIGSETFPGSANQFETVNCMLKELASTFGARFLDPSESGECDFYASELYYEDHFHLNLSGARAVAAFLSRSVITAIGLAL
jgi:hypothetical protein